MIYLSEFKFPLQDEEDDFFFNLRRTCYDSFYPFRILSKHNLRQIDFEPVTILYGGNGSGKTTALNVIAQKLELERDTLYNRSNFFEEYLKMCDYETERSIPNGSRIITSDDVFDYMLNLRNINEGINRKREDLFEDYLESKYSKFAFNSLEDYDKLKRSIHQEVKRSQNTSEIILWIM